MAGDLCGCRVKSWESGEAPLFNLQGTRHLHVSSYSLHTAPCAHASRLVLSLGELSAAACGASPATISICLVSHNCLICVIRARGPSRHCFVLLSQGPRHNSSVTIGAEQEPRFWARERTLILPGDICSIPLLPVLYRLLGGGCFSHMSIEVRDIRNVQFCHKCMTALLQLKGHFLFFLLLVFLALFVL